jgi:hypothetical protein
MLKWPAGIKVQLTRRQYNNMLVRLERRSSQASPHISYHVTSLGGEISSLIIIILHSKTSECDCFFH